jgi:predicted nucleic acid-binding protein
VRVLDTSVAIDYLRDDERAAAVVEPLVAGDPLVASEVTRFEILVGVLPPERDLVEAFFEQLVWVPVDEGVARRGAALARTYRASHGGIEDADYLIAATAVELQAGLLTTNARHFPMFKGLRPAY